MDVILSSSEWHFDHNYLEDIFVLSYSPKNSIRQAWPWSLTLSLHTNRECLRFSSILSSSQDIWLACYSSRMSYILSLDSTRALTTNITKIPSIRDLGHLFRKLSSCFKITGTFRTKRPSKGEATNFRALTDHHGLSSDTMHVKLCHPPFLEFSIKDENYTLEVITADQQIGRILIQRRPNIYEEHYCSPLLARKHDYNTIQSTVLRTNI